MRIPANKNRSVDLHSFAMIPKADIPRSSFDRQHTHKTTIDAGYLVPIYVDEVLPGDTFNLRMTAFARLATPIFPLMDNLHFQSFFFFVPYRLIWTNWVKMMGEQENPGDSISYTTPQIVSKASGYDANTIFDYMGLPTLGQLDAAATYSHSALPLRAYNLIWNEWFRDENLQNSVAVAKGDGPDLYTAYSLLRRGKRKDYFTGALPWPQKGATAVSLPLGTTAPIKTSTTAQVTGAQEPMKMVVATTGNAPGSSYILNSNATSGNVYFGGAAGASSGTAYPNNLYADLSAATAATINQLRLAFQTQKVLERDARGGTRYTEIIRAHFGVISPDARLQRPEYLGGGHAPVGISPVPQTQATGASGTTTPLGALGGVGALKATQHGFTQSFTEHGVILGLVNIYADLTYQQGVRKMWNRNTRFDYYLPAFAMLGEQAILNKEIYAQGDSNDDLVFGYQERWAEYRYFPSQITGYFRSTTTGTIDPWHVAQKFTALPTLNSTFIQETPPMDRILAVSAEATGKQFLFDSFFSTRLARPMPMYSVPGLIDHF